MDYIESGRDFSPLFYSDRFQTFYIEKSLLYAKLKSESVKSVEFVSVQDKRFHFIEVKTSFPQPGNRKDLKTESQKLYDKLHHSIDLIVARKLGIKKHLNDESTTELGNSDVLDKDFSKYNLVFLVIMVDPFQKDWCEEAQVTLQKKMTPLKKIWDVKVLVIHENEARGMIKK